MQVPPDQAAGFGDEKVHNSVEINSKSKSKSKRPFRLRTFFWRATAQEAELFPSGGYAHNRFSENYRFDPARLCMAPCACIGIYPTASNVYFES